MVCCFLTGVQLPIDKALVLNRREARSLLAALNDRVASLRRVIEQLSPLDIDDDATRAAYPQRPGAAHKKHRLICKAVAEALAPAFPEITLFVGWPVYQSQARSTTLNAFRDHPQFGDVIRPLSDVALREAGKLGQAVLGLLDPARALARKTRIAVSAGTCVNHRKCKPAEVVALIRKAAFEASVPNAAGLDEADLAAVRAIPSPMAKAKRPDARSKPMVPNHDINRQP